MYLKKAIDGPELFRDFNWENLKDQIKKLEDIEKSWEKHLKREEKRKATLRERYPNVNWDEPDECELKNPESPDEEFKGFELSEEEMENMSTAYDEEKFLKD